MSQTQKTMIREFPLRSSLSGAVLGNSWLGLMAWGENNKLNITLGCADLWDHRGGMTWSPKQSYSNILAALQAQDAKAIRELFATDTENVPGQPARPSLIPLGRMVLTLPEDARLLRAEQKTGNGLTRIVLRKDSREETIEIRLNMTERGFFAIHHGNTDIRSVELIPSFRLCPELAKISFPSPMETASSFIQPMPNDDAFGVHYSHSDGLISGVFRRGTVPELQKIFATQKFPRWEELERENRSFWKKYWKKVPKMKLDNPRLEEIYCDGLYRFGAMTAADGTVPGLQGPWLEDDKLPPWSGDYHFNINIQMCHWPACRAGHAESLRPLFDMVWSWRNTLRKNAEYFAGIPDGYMLPHAVDDRCKCMGGFWTGTVDHASAAWIAQMMFDYCDYTGNLPYLRGVVFEFMRGVMRVFQTMIVPENGKLALPLSISPEYRGAAMNAWGRNSSFQLAAIHRLALNLQKGAQLLGLPEDPFWKEVSEKLPQASIYTENGKSEIGLWDGLPLEESHRHHSHLGGICPFSMIDPEEDAWREILDNTRTRWTSLGMGEWTGWCLPWASMLHTRFGNGDMAELILEIWKHAFTNDGGASLHDARYRGFTIFAQVNRGEIMQMDGAMGAVTAVQDMLLYARGETLFPFAGIPRRWKYASFEDMPAPGGFVIGGDYRKGEGCVLRVRATREATLSLSLPLAGVWLCDGHPFSGKIFRKAFRKGESVVLSTKKNS
ncbi:MAG: hypothetical protein BWY31_03935 [Lentisphaerae bacterium ADurb.Bin242]|nr:MAG: hypothetical protein BWY31_03935 [Lentisphaerae bacterium ADurb.Bin242]